MQKILLTPLTLFISIFSFAQTSAGLQTLKVKGIVVDSLSKAPLTYVTVALQDIKTHTSIKSTLAKDDGSFELIAAGGKHYNLVLSFISYSGKSIFLEDTAGVIDVGKLALARSLKSLKEVVISAQKPIIKQEADRLVYDVQADPDNKAITALDMISKVPLLSVDGMDNIRLRGSGNYKILINGKESALMARNPADILKSMPALNIEKIEVITTPPSKYDAEGLAGIINIITKNNTEQGYNGSVNMKYQTIYGPGYNANLTVKEGKFGMSAFGGINYQLNPNTPSYSSHTQYSPNQVIDQHSNVAFNGYSSFGNADLSYEIDSLNLLTGSLQYFHANFDSGRDQISQQTNSAGNLTQGYQLINAENSNSAPVDATINYELGFKKHKGELLTFSYKFSYSPHQQYSTNIITDRINYSQLQQPDFMQHDRSGSKVNTLQADYVYPLKKINIELGSKAILRQNFSTYSRDDLDSVTNNYMVNNNQTGKFNYRQNVYSIYNSYQLKLNKWVVKGGLRLEHTQINAFFSGTPLNRGYNNLVPSVAIQQSFNGNNFSFGYTQRIQRPGISQLNPFVNRANPSFISTGNPNLSPELNNTFDLTYSHYSKGSIIVNLNYGFSNNAIQNITYLTINNNQDTITTTTYQNLGSNRTLGLNISSNYSITKRLSFNANARISKIWLKGTFNGQFYTNDGYTGNANTSISYKFNNDYRLTFTANYYNGNLNSQGKDPNRLLSYYTVSKMLFNKKVTVAFIAVNPYSKYTTLKAYTNASDFSQINSLQTYYRYFIANINYKFGRLDKDIKKNRRNVNNDDIK